MKIKILFLSLTILSLFFKVNAQTQQADCNNLFLDTDTFYLAPATNVTVSGNLFYTLF